MGFIWVGNRNIISLEWSEFVYIDKGDEAFNGKDPIDSFCGLWDTKI